MGFHDSFMGFYNDFYSIIIFSRSTEKLIIERGPGNKNGEKQTSGTIALRQEL